MFLATPFYSLLAMLPSPTKLRSHNFAEPINCRQHNHEKRKGLHMPFTKSSSRVVVQKSPAQGAFTSLILSLRLANRIHELILTSRRIQALANLLYSGTVTSQQSKPAMDALVDSYDRLRESVVTELEGAWVAAGFLPANIPTYPPASEILGATIDRHDWNHGKSNTNNLKRSLAEDGEESNHTKNAKKMKVESKLPENITFSGGMVEPCESVQDTYPLTPEEVYRIQKGWKWHKAWGKGEGRRQSALVSPKTVECCCILDTGSSQI